MSTQRQRRFPRWFAPLAFLIGGLCALGGYYLSGQQVRAGQAPTAIEIFDDTGEWDTDGIEEALSTVAWGRDMRNLVVISPLGEEAEPGCRIPSTPGTCVGPRYEGYFDDYGFEPRHDIAFLWIDPEREFVRVEVGSTEYDSNLNAVTKNISESLSQLLVEGNLKPEHFHNAFQILADGEAQAQPISIAGRIGIALIAGLFGTILTAVALIALLQFLEQRQYARSATTMSRAERQAAIKDAKEVYTRASLKLDEMELLKAAYPVLEKRIDQWEVRYTDLARLMFEAETKTDRELASIANAGLVADSARLAGLVDRGMEHLLADEEFLTGESDTHIATEELEDAIAETRKLLGSSAKSWDVPELNLKKRERTLAAFDTLANDLATATEPALTAYVTEHGRPYEGRDAIEDLQKIRGLDSLTPGSLPEDAQSISANELKDLSKTSREINTESSRIRVPISPLLVAITAALATVIGVLFTVFNAPTETVLRQADTPYATVPDNLSTVEYRGSALTELPAAAGEDLRPPVDIEIIDKGNMIDDEQALKDALNTLGFATDARFIILTTDEELPADPEHPILTDETVLPELFPEYYEYLDEFDDVITTSEDVIMWFAANDAQLDMPLNHEIRADKNTSYYDWLPGSVIDSTNDVSINVWNVAVNLAHVSRDIEIEGSTSLVTTGAESTVSGVVVGLVAFVILTAAAMIVFRPVQASVARRRWRREITDTMTALTMSLDGLKLETTHIADDTSYPADDRYTRFHEDYLEFVAAIEKLENTSGNAHLLDVLNVARLLRGQAESLWRIRPVLFSLTHWSADWDDEIAYGFAASNEPDPEDYVDLSGKLFSGRITPLTALKQLDALCCAGGAGRARSLDNMGDLTKIAGECAERGALTLPASTTRSFTETATEAPRLTTTDLPSFTINGDIFTDSWKTLKVLNSALDKTAFPLLGFGILVLLMVAFVPSKYTNTNTKFGQWGMPQTITVDRQPLSVEVADYADILDDEALVDGLADINLGGRAHFLIVGVDQCDYDLVGQFDVLHGEDFPRLWSLDEDGHPHTLPGAYFLCISETDLKTMLLGQYDEVSRDKVFGYSGGNPTDYLLDMFQNADPFLKQEFKINDDVHEWIVNGE